MTAPKRDEPRHLTRATWLRAVLGPPGPMQPRWSTVGSYTVWKLRALLHLAQWRWWLSLGLVLCTGVTGVWDGDLPALAVAGRSLLVAVGWFFLPFVLDGFQLSIRTWWHARHGADTAP